MFTERTGIAVWLHSTKHVRQLRKYGVIHYVSKSMKYGILYCNQKEVEETLRILNSLPFVEKAEQSMKPEIRTEFSGPVHPKEKSFEYNVGI
ncbi:YlbG family protein [Alteribacillus sp. JSM 102045]|uniref:YlbG family protein n=1 Tax=Alteribacillus sp. JSM 102045 TaxID=1562101 RepID=UPI0035BFCF26